MITLRGQPFSELFVGIMAIITDFRYLMYDSIISILILRDLEIGCEAILILTYAKINTVIQSMWLLCVCV